MTPDVKDPETGCSFDGRYDELMPCGCVVFYRGGRVPCEDHGAKPKQHTTSCRAYGNYQPPYEDCTCGAETQ